MGTVAIQIWVQIEVHAHKSKLPEVVLCVFLNRSYSKKLQSLIKLGPPFPSSSGHCGRRMLETPGRSQNLYPFPPAGVS